jgi:hypothetical protein
VLFCCAPSLGFWEQPWIRRSSLHFLGRMQTVPRRLSSARSQLLLAVTKRDEGDGRFLSLLRADGCSVSLIGGHTHVQRRSQRNRHSKSNPKGEAATGRDEAVEQVKAWLLSYSVASRSTRYAGPFSSCRGVVARRGRSARRRSVLSTSLWPDDHARWIRDGAPRHSTQCSRQILLSIV